MKDLVLLTLGMNPLPCLVETYRLCQDLKKSKGSYPDILPLETAKAKVKNIQEILEKRIQEEDPGGRLCWLTPAKIQDPFTPREISQVLEQYRKIIPWQDYEVHFPYTGGTKAVSMEALVFLLAQPGQLGEKKRPAFRRYYLSPDSHTLLNDRGLSTVVDERKQWALTLDQMAKIHDLRPPVVDSLRPELEEAAQLTFRVLRRESNYGRYREWFNDHDKDYRSDVPWCPINSPDWLSATVAIARVFPGRLTQHNGMWTVSLANSPKDGFRSFLDNQSLELCVYRCVRDLLPVENSVSWSVHLQTKYADHDFQLDVVAIIGYQVINISCTMSSHRATCKGKAFEAIHRARQLGGDQAKAVLVCMMRKDEPVALEKDIADDMGLPLAKRPVCILGGKHFLPDDFDCTGLRTRMDQYFTHLETEGAQ